jgi:hypothetical protein
MSFKGKHPVELSITRPRGSGVSVADDGDCADAATEAAAGVSGCARSGILPFFKLSRSSAILRRDRANASDRGLQFTQLAQQPLSFGYVPGLQLLEFLQKGPRRSRVAAVALQLHNDLALASNVFVARRDMFLCFREVALEHFSVHRGRVP